MITQLATARLVVTGHSTFDVDIAANKTVEETVEIVHEALIRGWGRLGQWMRTDRAFLGKKDCDRPCASGKVIISKTVICYVKLP